MDLTATDEQKVICAYPLNKGANVLIRAYAGSGKSTTLRLLSETYAKLRFLYLCFNNSVATEARAKFPRNVTPTTIHSLAYRHVKDWYPKTKTLGLDLRPMEIREHLSLASNQAAVLIRNTLHSFLCSPDTEVSRKHLPPNAVARQETAAIILEQTTRLWRMMRDKQSELPLSHDGYLKLFVEQDPQVQQYDVILLDEGQDTNPITAEYIRKQMGHGIACIVVGDHHQSIYGFRGAANFMQEMQQLDGVQQFQLATSFRLTSAVADIASDILNAWKLDPVRITGRQPPGRDKTRAFIARTNATLMTEAERLIEQGITKIHFAGTSEKDRFNPEKAYGFAEILDIHHLRTANPKEVRSPYIKRFASYQQIKDAADSAEAKDVELAALVKFVEKRQDQVPDVLARIQKAACGPADAQITLSTAHRAKGLEWDHVTIADDFMDLCDAPAYKEELTADEFDQEINLIYVAVTRSLGGLVLPESLLRWREAYLAGSVPEMSDRARRKLKVPHKFHTVG